MEDERLEQLQSQIDNLRQSWWQRGAVTASQAWRAFGQGRTKLDGTGLQIKAETSTTKGGSIAWLKKFVSRDPLDDPPATEGMLMRTYVGAEVEFAAIAAENLSDYLGNNFAARTEQYATLELETLSAGAQVILRARDPGNTNYTDGARISLYTDATAANMQLDGWPVYLDKSHALSGYLSPSQITSNQNNYAPTGYKAVSVLRLSTDASRDITGIAVDGFFEGRVLLIVNVGSFDIVLKNASGSSTAAHQFALKADITIAPNGGVYLWYDTVSDRWRCVGSY